MKRVPLRRRLVGNVLDLTGAASLGRSFLGARGSYIRAVNYHSVAPREAGAFADHLRYFRKHFVPAGIEDLAALLRGEWPHAKPGILLSFDDGLRTDYEVVAPLLEQQGFTGWFFVPVGLVLQPPAGQRALCAAARVTPVTQHGDGRVFLSESEVKSLAHRHVVGCHTVSHVRLSASRDSGSLREEIVGGRRILGEIIGREVATFCWVGGEESAYSREAAGLIRSAGYRYSFMTNSEPIRPHTDPFQLQRTNIESHYPISFVKLQLSGLVDIRYALKRRRVNALTAA